MQEKAESKLKTTIIILSVLLAVSLLLLAGIIVYSLYFKLRPVSMIVPDNIITPEEQKASSIYMGEIQPLAVNGGFIGPRGVSLAAQGQPEVSQSPVNAASALSLHDRNPGDNTPFEVRNMFPGDSVTEYYCVRVSHKGDVVLRFRADVGPGYEKLAEVLKCRVVLAGSGETLYDGPMCDMPYSLNSTLAAGSSTTSEVYYEITAYLDTSVDNEYMNKELMADFRWWVEETENLDPPQTGDSSAVYLWICLGAVSLFLLILLLKKRKKENVANER